MDNKHYVDPNVDSGRFSEPEELEADYTEVSYDCSVMLMARLLGHW